MARFLLVQQQKSLDTTTINFVHGLLWKSKEFEVEFFQNTANQMPTQVTSPRPVAAFLFLHIVSHTVNSMIVASLLKKQLKISEINSSQSGLGVG